MKLKLILVNYVHVSRACLNPTLAPSVHGRNPCRISPYISLTSRNWPCSLHPPSFPSILRQLSWLLRPPYIYIYIYFLPLISCTASSSKPLSFFFPPSFNSVPAFFFSFLLIYLQAFLLIIHGRSQSSSAVQQV